MLILGVMDGTSLKKSSKKNLLELEREENNGDENLMSLKMRPRPGVGVIYCGLESRVVPRPGTKGPPSCPHAGSVPDGITARN